jgi:membrane protein
MILSIAALFVSAFTLYVKVGNLPALRQTLAVFLAGKTAAFLMLMLAFAFLYKMIPRTRVAWSASFYGGFFAALLYEICRAGLHLYVSRILAYNKLWGSLSLIPVFILTIYVLSIILILGNDMSFIAQNYRALKENREWRKSVLRR